MEFFFFLCFPGFIRGITCHVLIYIGATDTSKVATVSLFTSVSTWMTFKNTLMEPLNRLN